MIQAYTLCFPLPPNLDFSILLFPLLNALLVFPSHMLLFPAHHSLYSPIYHPHSLASQRSTFPKSQTLNYRGGSPVHDGRERAKKDAYNHAPPPPAWKTASGEVPPPWLAFDKKV
jgi:hypothetical protein